MPHHRSRVYDHMLPAESNNSQAIHYISVTHRACCWHDGMYLQSALCLHPPSTSTPLSDIWQPAHTAGGHTPHGLRIGSTWNVYILRRHRLELLAVQVVTGNCEDDQDGPKAERHTSRYKSEVGTAAGM